MWWTGFAIAWIVAIMVGVIRWRWPATLERGWFEISLAALVLAFGVFVCAWGFHQRGSFMPIAGVIAVAIGSLFATGTTISMLRKRRQAEGTPDG
jgi:hypothetical protein